MKAGILIFCSFLSSGLFAFTTDTGAAGNLTIDTENLIIRDGTLVSTSTLLGDGDGGNLTIRASDSVEITSVLDINDPTGLFANTIGGTGKAGDIEIDTKNLILRGGTQINSVTGTSGVVGNIGLIPIGGEGGNIRVNASESVELSGTSVDGSFPSILTAESFSASPAGDVRVETENLIIEDQAQIATSTFGSGDAGELRIIATDIKIIGESADSEFRSGFLLAGSSGLFATVEQDASGTGGDVIIETENLLITDVGGISASTSGSGDAGDLSITTANLSLTNGGRIDASTFGEGNAGNIIVNANSVILNNNAIINAATGSGDRGNVTLQVAEDIRLENNSLISAAANQDADGGNVNINAEFIIAFPSNGDGSDIIANAERGEGGNINITAEALLGISEGQAQEGNRTNDIDASSDFGLDGNVTFNVPDTNNFQETAELSSNVISCGQQ